MFDPSSSFFYANWTIILTFVMIIGLNKLNKLNSKIEIAKKNIIAFIVKEINQLIEKKHKISNSLLIKVFIAILVINIVAIFPFNFTPTAHISIRFTLRLTIWASTLFFGWGNNFKKMIIHLTPLRTPNLLINFIVLIEIVRIIIRPITLSIRLSANIVAGHLLISLLSSYSLRTINNTLLSMLFIATLIILEVGVALIQAYVLITLLLLYQNETS